MKISKSTERWSPLILLVAVLLLWQLVVAGFGIADFIFPSPWQIALQFIEFKAPLLEAAWKTFWVTMMGFAISIVVGDAEAGDDKLPQQQHRHQHDQWRPAFHAT